ncbi:uncharacterized protein G6M90_00g030470 [Metarhizium brunneum]|uniref:Uncharacterized protein n=1 Tax=Metarhizium brunneum TaxID=500148 RepID=A0A7D5UX82_9HYPO|nr:hypothetical protein G6M90_00g030470 [Metarhizium brunneum]
MDSDREMDAAEETDPTLRPTHRLKDIKAGDYSVQLLVSTKDHVYDAENVEAGTSSWQVIGAWDESSVPELSKFLNSRQTTASRDPTGSTTTFGTRYGGGFTLGPQKSDNESSSK